MHKAIMNQKYGQAHICFIMINVLQSCNISVLFIVLF